MALTEMRPAIDEALLAGYHDLDVGFVAELVNEFLREAPRRIDAMRDACAAGEGAALGMAAHALKGSARVFGAEPLAELCECLERLSSIDETAHETRRRLASEYERVRRVLEPLCRACPLEAVR